MKGVIIEGFELLEPMRKTSTSTTWKAMQNALSRIVAIKVLHPEFAADRQRLSTLLDVARAVARIKHPNLIQVYDVVHRPPEAPYLIHEFVDGPSLADLLNRQDRLPPEQTLTIAHGVAAALGEAWRLGHIVHRNLKPSEISIDTDGTPKVADFGLAAITSAISDPEQREAHIVGTPNYLSPEQARGDRNLDGRTDMYALGATLYHALTGQVPFDEFEPVTVLQRHATDQIPHPQSLAPDIRIDICVFLQRLMMKNPADRFPNWETVAKEIRQMSARKFISGPQQAPVGFSTIAPLAKPSAPLSPAPPRQASPSKRPLTWLSKLTRQALWSVLWLWLIVLGRWRWQSTQPAAPPPEAPASAEVKAASPSPFLPLATDTLDPSFAFDPDDTLNLPDITDPSAPDPDFPKTPVAQETPAMRPATEIPPMPVVPDHTLRALAESLRALDLERARSLARELDDQPGIEALRAALDALPHPDRLVENGLMGYRGNQIRIFHNNMPRIIRPIQIVDGDINVEIFEDNRSYPLWFTASQLSHAERLRLAARPANETEQAALALLFLAAGNSDGALRTAGRCGPLEPILRAAVAQQQ